MSKMFDYITKGGDKVAELEASLEHMGGHLEIELEEADKLRAEIAKLRAALKDCAFVAQHGTPAKSNDLCAVTDWIGRRAKDALESDEQQGESGK